jgi:hypothetical protein
MEGVKQSFHDFIVKYLRDVSTILELGSGSGSLWLADNGYCVHSIEHSDKWIGKYEKVNYIYAPLKQHEPMPDFEHNSWYDPAYLSDLPNYDLIIIDGPPGKYGRCGFYKYLDLFDTSVPMIFDDVHRLGEFRLICKISRQIGRPYFVETRLSRTSFGVIMPEGVEWEPIKQTVPLIPLHT